MPARSDSPIPLRGPTRRAPHPRCSWPSQALAHDLLSRSGPARPRSAHLPPASRAPARSPPGGESHGESSGRHPNDDLARERRRRRPPHVLDNRGVAICPLGHRRFVHTRVVVRHTRATPEPSTAKMDEPRCRTIVKLRIRGSGCLRIRSVTFLLSTSASSALARAGRIKSASAFRTNRCRRSSAGSVRPKRPVLKGSSDHESCCAPPAKRARLTPS